MWKSYLDRDWCHKTKKLKKKPKSQKTKKICVIKPKNWKQGSRQKNIRYRDSRKKTKYEFEIWIKNKYEF